MGFVELLLVSASLAMDAFAVSVCKGLGMSRLNVRHAAVIALFFGGFQALMPVAGWMLGSQFASIVMPLGHWVAFGLLAFVGCKMIWDALHDESEPSSSDSGADDSLDFRELLMLAVATSIDALAVGISFVFLDVDITQAAACIGIVTFALSFGGVAIGHQFGSRWEKPSAIAGGITLVLIGLKTVLEHLLS